jgi:hypothetical protein
MARNRLRLVALLLFAPVIAGCAGEGSNSGPGSHDGDCNARIEWDGTVYRQHNAVDQRAPRGEQLGSGDVLDCDAIVAAVEVYAVDGVDPTLAIKVIGEWRGVYVAEDARRSSWPDVLTVDSSLRSRAMRYSGNITLTAMAAERTR